MKKLLFLAVLVISATNTFGRDADELAICTMLAAQISEWNKGNIDGYMKGYWENDSLVFIGRNGPTYGYHNTLTRYKKAYPDREAMGKLVSTIIAVKRLSDEYYFVIGKWELQRSKDNLSGSYTLLLRKIKGIWVIINDHSS